jgi:predicted P-loop ATPase
LRLNHKPLELKDKNYERALIEFLSHRRAERLAEVIAMITEPLSRAGVAQSDSTMLALFGWLFKDPAYALAAVKTVLWQIKRKMLRMEIKEPLFTVLYGKQKGGKSSFWRLLFTLIRDLTKTVDVSELVNEAQLDLYSYFVIDTDEMAKAERACLNKLKNIVTTETVTRRIYYTQSLADVRMCATLVGSSNMPVASLIQDVSGMRRFNQVDMRLSTPETKLHWDEIVRADYLSLWRSVDAEGEWPMLAFQEQLEAKQEGMRPIDRVEAWLANFTFKPRIPPTLAETPESFTPWADGTVAYAAFDLFTQSFSVFEEKAFPGMHMTLGNWGVRFKAMIDEGSAPEWGVETRGRRTVYYYTLPAADEKAPSQHAGVVVAMLPRRS